MSSNTMKEPIAQMNESHQDAILDFARYYGRAPYHSTSAHLTSFTTLNSLDIEYTFAEKTKRVRVSFAPPLRDKGEFLPRMIAMAQESSIARVPEVEFARPALSIALFSLMLIFGCVSFTDNTSLSSWPFAIFWTSARQASNFVFVGHGRLVFCLASFVHIAEAAYCAYLTSGLMKTAGRGYSRVAGWAVQTLLCGFPSLLLLLEKLDRSESAKERVA